MQTIFSLCALFFTKLATEAEYGRSRKRSDAAEDSSSKRSVSAQPPDNGSAGPQTPPTTAGPPRPLAGSLASNRKRIAGRESTSSGGSRQSVQSPLEGNLLAAVDAEELREQFKGKEELVQAIEAKLARWEATTVATLQEIRDLKDLFAQMK